MTATVREEQSRRLDAIIRADPDLMLLLTRLRSLRLPQWRLGCRVPDQTVWNALTSQPRGTGIQDYDLIYFDAADLSWEAEDAVIRRITPALRDCVGPVEIRNQARVHLWFQDRFGSPYPALTCADEALRRYDRWSTPSGSGCWTTTAWISRRLLASMTCSR